MAFRGGAVAAAGSGSSQVITVSGIGIQLNDIVLLSLENFIGNSPVFPSGFAQVPGTAPGPNDGNVSVVVFSKVATASEPSTYTITGLDFGQTVHCRVYSGRSISATFTTQSQTTSGSNSPSPLTFAVTGLTAAAADDVVVFIGDQFGTPQGTTPGYTPDAAFANGLVANDASNGHWTVSSDHVNVSAGATGTIAGTMTFGAGNTKYVAQVVSMAIGNNFAPPVAGLNVNGTLSTMNLGVTPSTAAPRDPHRRIILPSWRSSRRPELRV